VVVGLDRAVNYYKLQTAMAYLRSRPDTIFVVSWVLCVPAYLIAA
jgi:hypothetical protein